MADMNDMDLMREYADRNSELAFAELVHRHINLVYSVALRCIGNPQDAQDVTQVVFIILARKMAGLRQRMTLTGWLYETTRFTARQLLRTRSRQQAREQEAYMQSTLNDSDIGNIWRQLAPLLEEAMARLNEKERALLALRFYENKSGAEAAALLGIREQAAHKRTARAVEKLRAYLARRGLGISAGALIGAVSANSIQAAPVALAKSVTAAAIAQGAGISGSTLTLIKTTIKIMTWTKAKTAVVIGMTAILAIGTMTVAVKTVKHFTSERVESYFTHMDTDYLETAPPLLVLRPSHYANQGNYIFAGHDLGPNGKLMRRGCSFREILSTAYGVGPEEMILPANSPEGQFDLLLTVANNPRQALQAEIRKQFGLAGHIETRDTDVLVLKNINPRAPGLKISNSGGPKIWRQRGSLKLVGYKMSDPTGYDLAHTISSLYHLPVIDETGLTSPYDIDIHWNGNLNENAQQKEIENVMRDQLGLELVPANLPVKMLVLEKSID